MSAARLRDVINYVDAPARHELEVVADLSWGRRPMPMQSAHACGHLKGIIWFLRWAAKQPASFTGSDLHAPHWDDKQWAFSSCRLNGYLERVTVSRRNGLLTEYWQISAAGREVLAKADAAERAAA